MWTLPARLDAGAPYPLGATRDGLGTNFLIDTTGNDRSIFEIENGIYGVRDRPAVLINAVADEPLAAGASA